MFHACATRFDVTENLKNFLVFQSELSRALFSSEKISDFGIVALSFVCDKYYPIMD